MPLTIQDSRILIKRSTVTTEVPTAAPSNDHTDGAWDALDIYIGELFSNVEDRKLWLRFTNSIDEIVSVPLGQANGFNFANATGTDTYVAALTPALEAYTAGNIFSLTFANPNTGASTLQVNLLAAKSILKNGIPLSSGDIATGINYLLAYDGTSFHMIGAGGAGSVNPGTQYRLAYYASTGTAVSEASAITAAKALKSDANGVPTHFDTSTEPSMAELTYVKGVTSAIQTQFAAKADMPYDVQSDSSTGFTLDNDDFPATKIRWYTCSNAGAITITIPSDATLTTVDTGDTIVFEQTGAGQITLAVSGTTFRSADGALTSRTQYSKIWATKVAASTWSIGGDIL